MAKQDDLFLARKGLDEICDVPDKIISVYSLEKHVWSGSNSEAARKSRLPELQTVREFQLDPVRPFLTDVLRHMAAPWKPGSKDDPVGQGYWIQAEFGSGKSHLLACLAALALGSKDAWEIVRDKEAKADRGKRESLFRFWEEGLEAKTAKGKLGIFVIVKTLVGAGGGTIGLNDKGQRLSEYILDAAKEQLQAELGKNLSLYPTERLADRFTKEDLDRYRNDLKKFLRDSRFFEEDEFEDVDDFLRDIQQNKSPEYKRSCGNKLWRFYTEYLKVKPDLPTEAEEVLQHMVETIIYEGYCGVLIVLDEVSLFMKNRTEDQRTDDEKTLVVLSNRLTKGKYNLPVWTVCAAQQAIESKMGVKNIIADDRLKLVKLLEEDKDYYEIVLARVREIKDPAAIGNYYLYYKRGFSWPNSIGEPEFRHFFPFHKPALEVLRAITYELTTTRSAIHFMHQTLKHQVKQKGRELIRLWELFDETVRYEEDPSGVHAGLVAIKTKREVEYRAYEVCRRQIDSLTKGALKVNRDKAIKTIQTLFLYHIAKTRQQGLTPEELANSVLIERSPDANVDENNQHYESLAENLKKELRQIVQTFDEENRPRYRFDPVFTGVDPRTEFKKARDDAESNEVMQKEAWEHMLGMAEWEVQTRQMKIDLSNGVRSIFRDVAPFSNHGDQTLEVNWQGRIVSGMVGMQDLSRIADDNLMLPAINSDETDNDYAILVSTKPVSDKSIQKLLNQRKDPRIILWSPDALNTEERDRVLDFAAYRKLVSDWHGKETEDAVAVISWVVNSLQTELAKIMKAVENSYARGKMDALNNSKMKFQVAGELAGILTPIVGRVLPLAYESRDIKFDSPFQFRKEEGIKVINGIVRTGSIPKGTKPNQNTSAAQNFGYGLRIMKKGADRALDISENLFVQDIWTFIEKHLVDEGQTMKIETLYKNFMGVGGPKDYGLNRRMVQIYLLCLVREGRIRLDVSPKAGLSNNTIDYSTLAGIEFTAKVVDSILSVQKIAQPENWDVLRPYAEKLLGEGIKPMHDDAVISEYRSKLVKLFAGEKGPSSSTNERATSLFDALKSVNPYATELEQVANLFTATVESGNDISQILSALKDAFGYQAFDNNQFSQQEVDDLSNRLRNYRDVQRFLFYEPDLRAAAAYCGHSLPDMPDLKATRKIQGKLAQKLAELRPFIASEVALKTELIGKIPPEAGETSTLGALIHEYTSVYLALHDNVVDRVDGCRREIEGILEGNEFKAMGLLEKIVALQPAVSEGVRAELDEAVESLFVCPAPSRASVEDQLRRSPLHECNLSCQNGQEYITEAEGALQHARKLFNATIDRKLAVLQNAAVRERLEQGKGEKIVASILPCSDLAALRKLLVEAVLNDPAIVDVINRYLKKIVVKVVKLTDFKPSANTIEADQVTAVAQEFQQFLEKALDEVKGSKDVLPMIQIE
jgi:hypothetical protein